MRTAPPPKDYERMTSAVRLQALGLLQDEADVIRASREVARARADSYRDAARAIRAEVSSKLGKPRPVQSEDEIAAVIESLTDAREMLPAVIEAFGDTPELQAERRAALNADALAYDVGRPKLGAA